MSVSEQLGTQRRVDLSAGPIHYAESGDGDPIVFVHGVFVNGDLWRNVVPELDGRYRCITPDWPLGSHPESMRPDADLSTPALAALVAEFLAALDLERVTLVGNDTGGAICQLAVTDHPDRIARLVLTSCDAFEVYPPAPFAFLKVIPQVPGADRVLARSLRLPFVRRLPIAYGWVMTDQPPRAIADSYTRPLLDARVRHDAKKVLRGISSEHTMAAAATKFGGFSGPVMLAWAADDKLFPLSLASRLANVLPQARLEIVPDSRTFVAEDQPETVARLLHEFMGAND